MARWFACCLGLGSASMAHFELAAGKTSIAVTHRSIEEIWFFLSGSGQMWRKLGEQVEVVDVHANVSLTIPPGTHFQFRSYGPAPLTAIGTQIPPWPGDDEAVACPRNLAIRCFDASLYADFLRLIPACTWPPHGL